MKRKSTSRPAIARFRHYEPYGKDIEYYCIRRLLENFPARRETIENWKNEDGSFLDTCMELNLIRDEKEAMHYLQTSAKRGTMIARLMEIARRFIDEGWLEHQNIEALMETIAPERQAIEDAARDVLLQDEQLDVPLNYLRRYALIYQ